MNNSKPMYGPKNRTRRGYHADRNIYREVSDVSVVCDTDKSIARSINWSQSHVSRIRTMQSALDLFQVPPGTFGKEQLLPISIYEHYLASAKKVTDLKMLEICTLPLDERVNAYKNALLPMPSQYRGPGAFRKNALKFDVHKIGRALNTLIRYPGTEIAARALLELVKPAVVCRDTTRDSRQRTLPDDFVTEFFEILRNYVPEIQLRSK